jgi:hypothetical protein
MKKPMKFKRYDEGGEVADKEAGLKASKGEDVGFFQRLRMGNIDDPNSEAYKRFGAGRGRSERNPVNESVSVNEPMAVARPSMKPNPIFAAGEEQGKRQPSGDASVAEDYAKRPRNPEAEQEADNPRRTASKPSTSKTESKITSTPKAPAYVQSYTEEMMEADNPRVKVEKSPAAKLKPAAETSTAKTKPASEAPKSKTSMTPFPRNDESRRMMSEGVGKAVSGATSGLVDYLGSLESTSRYMNKKKKAEGSGPFDKGSSNEYKRGGNVKKMASGGSVSSASRRADGIATKGKTRGRMC